MRFSNIKIFLKSLLVQVLLNKENMQQEGYRILSDNKFNNYINTNPYFATIMLGFLTRVNDIRRIELFASITAFIGDDLFWANLKPVVCMISLIILFFRLDYSFLLIPFIFYFLLTNFLRYYGYNYALKNIENIPNFYSEYIYKGFRMHISRVKFIFYGVLSVLILFLTLKLLNFDSNYVIILCLIIIVNFLVRKFDYYFLILIFIMGLLWSIVI